MPFDPKAQEIGGQYPLKDQEGRQTSATFAHGLRHRHDPTRVLLISPADRVHAIQRPSASGVARRGGDMAWYVSKDEKDVKGPYDEDTVIQAIQDAGGTNVLVTRVQ